MESNATNHMFKTAMLPLKVETTAVIVFGTNISIYSAANIYLSSIDSYLIVSFSNLNPKHIQRVFVSNLVALMCKR